MDVDFLPMAKPDAINHLKIRHSYAVLDGWLFGSFH
jgi:hypothetical protein